MVTVDEAVVPCVVTGVVSEVVTVDVTALVAVLGMAVVVVGRGGAVCVVVLSSGAFVVERCGLTADADTKIYELRK